MADLVPVAAQVAPVNDSEFVHKTYIANAAVTAGQLVYELTTGKVGLADATDDTLMIGLAGVTMQAAAAGRPVDVMKKGALAGMGVSALNAGASVYGSETAGGISDAAIAGSGKVSQKIGTVRAMSDAPDYTKVLYIDIPDNLVITENA
jgi:hypothetical protein